MDPPAQEGDGGVIRALIVDDEPNAREELHLLLAAHADFEITGNCANAIEALRSINRDKPDVVFLDIQMPRISGIELIGMVEPDILPRVVFVTAFDDYAVAAFEENAFDYLLKPIEPDRFNKTLSRLRRVIGERQPINGLEIPELNQIPCFVGNRIRLVQLPEAEYAYSDISGVHIVTADGESHTDMALRVLETKTDFVQCHRQYLVRLDKVREIQLIDGGLGEIKTLSGKTVPVSRRHLRDLKKRLGLAG